MHMNDYILKNEKNSKKMLMLIKTQIYINIYIYFFDNKFEIDDI